MANKPINKEYLEDSLKSFDKEVLQQKYGLNSFTDEIKSMIQTAQEQTIQQSKEYTNSLFTITEF